MNNKKVYNVFLTFELISSEEDLGRLQQRIEAYLERFDFQNSLEESVGAPVSYFAVQKIELQ